MRNFTSSSTTRTHTIRHLSINRQTSTTTCNSLRTKGLSLGYNMGLHQYTTRRTITNSINTSCLHRSLQHRLHSRLLDQRLKHFHPTLGYYFTITCINSRGRLSQPRFHRPSNRGLQPTCNSTSTSNTTYTHIRCTTRHLNTFSTTTMLRFRHNFQHCTFRRNRITKLYNLNTIRVSRIRTTCTHLFRTRHHFRQITMVNHPTTMITLHRPRTNTTSGIHYKCSFCFRHIAILGDYTKSFHPPGHSFQNKATYQGDYHNPTQH